MVLLTHGYFLEEDLREKEIMKPYAPLGILYVSAFLEQHGARTEVLDSTFTTFEKWGKRVLATRPDFIGIYTNLMTKLNVLKMIAFIKSENQLSHTTVVLGGPEVRHHAENFLRHGADVIVFGEGEETMLEVVSAKAKTAWPSMEGIGFLDESGKMVRTPERKNIRSMDQLPFPDRKKINLQDYFRAWKEKHGSSSISLSTMRGCPYTCKWCSRAVYGQSYRRRSPALVVDEIESLQKDYAFDHIWFVDDVFSISFKWLTEFAGELEKRKIKIRYECITRADRLNEEVIRDLKRSGCFRVWIGAESGSQQVIDLMDRRVEVGQVRNMIRLARKNGIEAGTFIMLGYPGETEKDIEETIHHLKESNPDQFTITVAYPIRGTPLYTEVEERFVQTLDWATSTDRDIDFKRTYSRRFYNHAIRRVNNEVRWHQTKRTSFKLKSWAAKAGMMMEKLLSSR